MTTIICLGNEMRGDDAAGLEVAARLRARGVPARVEQPQDLLDAWAGADDVVIVDAVRSKAAPGSVHRIDVGRAPLPAVLSNRSTHLFGLADAIELARMLGRMPAQLRIVGIEAGAVGVGDPLSPEVERAIERVVGEFAHRVSA